jgi:hypothetical protein
MSTFERYLKLDLVKWLRFLRDLDLLPTVLGQDWSFVFLQRFEGSVTVTPKVHVPDFFRLISDPDEKNMKRCIFICINIEIIGLYSNTVAGSFNIISLFKHPLITIFKILKEDRKWYGQS